VIACVSTAVFASDVCLISGTIVQENSDLSISGALVYLYNLEEKVVDSAITDNNGYFVFSVIGGDYFVSAEKGNFIKEFYPSAYCFVNASVITARPDQNISIRIYLDRGGWLGGEFNYDGENIEYALISAMKIDEPHQGWIRSVALHGDFPQNYVLKGLIPGSYKILARATAKKTVYFPGVEDFNDAEIIEIDANIGCPDISFFLAEAENGFLSGNVSNLITGEGIPDVPVYIYQWKYIWEDPNLYTTHTLGNGDFQMTLPEGSYYLYLDCDNCIAGSGNLAMYYDNKFNPLLADLVEINADELTSDLNFVIDPENSHTSSISGSVLNSETGYGIGDITVTAIDYVKGISVSSAISHDDGDFRIDNLPVGEYLVMFSGSNILPYFHFESENWQEAEVFNVNGQYTGLSSDAITQDYGNPGLSISGIVTADGYAKAGARVYAYLEGIERPVAFSVSDEYGEYDIITGLVPGYYKIECDLVGYDHQIYPDIIHLDLLQNPDVDNINFGLLSTPTIISADQIMPEDISVSGNYPNPFNAGTIIEIYSGYNFEKDIVISVYNLLGQKVCAKNVILHFGQNYIQWNFNNLPEPVTTGIYFYHIDGTSKSYRMTYLK
jgi:hypothetical protein